MRPILSALVILTATLAALPVHAQTARPVFFEALYDVPVMPGLVEAKDQAMLFDKPDGRIASVTAASASLPPGRITAFYAETLPQLGWSISSANQYVRGEDRLKIDVRSVNGLSVAHFSLAPARSAARPR